MAVFQTAGAGRVCRARESQESRHKDKGNMKALCLLVGIAAWSIGSTFVLAQEHGLQSGLMRASKVAGMDVRNPANEKLGDIQDLMLEQETGTVGYAVLAFGGFLGPGA